MITNLTTNNIGFYGKPKPKQENKKKETQKPIRKEEVMNNTLRGVLMNTYIKNKDNTQISDLDEISNSLLIPDKFEVRENTYPQVEEKSRKKSLLANALPYVASALIATFMALTISNSYLKSQKLLQPGNVPQGIKLPVVGKNINLHSEEYFAIYMAICEPKTRNILGLLGVLAMSALTFAGTTCVDGIKKVWLKKQEADVKKNFEEQSIEIETKTFSGKLDVVREELVEKTKYFKEQLESKPIMQTSFSNSFANLTENSQESIFAPFVSFGKSILNTNDNQKNNDEMKNTSFLEKIKTFYNNAKDSPITLIAISVITVATMILAGKRIFKNIGQAARMKEDALSLSREKIRESISASVDEVKNAESSSRDGLISKLKEKLLSIGAEPDEITETFEKAGILGDEAAKLKDEIVKGVAEMKFGKGFYVQADPAMGGKEGTQFYIYIDQAKGYIYDVITHPENKFARYLLAAISSAGATGFLCKESLDAIKEAAVIKENSETELDLKRRLVDTEIRNFKSKKRSAIEPLIDDFNNKLQEGRPKEELKAMAENILLEIKNGPPFVYD